MAANSTNKELVYLLLQFLGEEKFNETLHMLERESGLFLDMKYVEELVLNGKWDEVEKYLSGFTGITDNEYSVKIFFEIRKQKYLEALDRQDREGAVHILTNELKVFATYDENLYREITQLITLDNLRQSPELFTYPDAEAARDPVFAVLKAIITKNPLLKQKLEFPRIANSRLKVLINQSLNCQNYLDYENSRGNSDDPRGNIAMRSSNYIAGNPFPSRPNMEQGSSSASRGNIGSTSLENNQALRVQGPAGNSIALTTSLPRSSERMLTPQNSSSASNAMNEFPKILVRTLNLGSTTTSLDFHPLRRILLVGTNEGDISVWEVGEGRKLVTRGFHIWNTESVSGTLKGVLGEGSAVAVRRVLWCNSYLLGVAYSKNMVHLYNYIGGDNLKNFLEIEAHNGSVNDLAFSTFNMKQCLITCGDDKTVKVWDVTSGIRLHSLEGHEGPVYSVCPRNSPDNSNTGFVLSTSINGKIKVWHVVRGFSTDFDAPGRSCTRMAYSVDGSRLFSGGTNRERESHIVEWNERDRTLKKTYKGLQNDRLEVLQFDITMNKFLACGDAFSVKFWDIDCPDLIADIYADEGELPARPRVRFSPDGSMIAVTATDFKIKILATRQVVRLMSDYEPLISTAMQVAPSTSTRNQDTRVEDMKPSSDELARLSEIHASNQVGSSSRSHPRGFD